MAQQPFNTGLSQQLAEAIKAKQPELKAAASDRMAVARAAKQAKQQQAQPKPADPIEAALQLIQSAEAQRAFLVLCALSTENQGNGYGPVVPHWRIVQTMQGKAESLLNECQSVGVVKRIMARPKQRDDGSWSRGGLMWIPSHLDDPTVRGARSSKGSRSSDIMRTVDAMLEGRKIA